MLSGLTNAHKRINDYMGQFLELILEKEEEKERSRALKGERTQEKKKG